MVLLAAWRSKSAAEPAPLADIVALLAEVFGSRGIASDVSVGIALELLCEMCLGLGLLGRPGEVGNSELLLTSPGRALAVVTDDEGELEGNLKGSWTSVISTVVVAKKRFASSGGRAQVAGAREPEPAETKADGPDCARG
jgi:hypothetical protein